jgi:hypothetical protein
MRLPPALTERGQAVALVALLGLRWGATLAPSPLNTPFIP